MVSGNRGAGLVVGGGATAVLGNRIGTAANGTAALGNGGPGVVVSGTSVDVGGPAAGAGNVIAHNGGTGVIIAPGWNGETVAGNAIYANGGLGIDLMCFPWRTVRRLWGWFRTVPRNTSLPIPVTRTQTASGGFFARRGSPSWTNTWRSSGSRAGTGPRGTGGTATPPTRHAPVSAARRTRPPSRAG